jgi:nucleoside 2-deoxyribosyltransferase
MILICHCTICGDYKITREAADDLPNDSRIQDKKYILSGLTRQNSALGNAILIRNDNLMDLIESAPLPLNVFDSMDRILLYIRNNLKAINGNVKIMAGFDYPIVFAKDEMELKYYIGQLIKINQIEEVEGYCFTLTLEGWKRTEELVRVNPLSRNAFVAMWFSDITEEAWKNGIYKAIDKAGFNPQRIDLVQHNEKICDRIIVEIKRSRFVVADFTGSRGGVYFEAGYAMGLGLPVIWTCREDWLDKLHFDTRQYNHIIWTDPEDLKIKLQDRIMATIPLL